MGRQKELQKLLEEMGFKGVYFQPPETVRLLYPCVIYNLEDIMKNYADNKLYNGRDRYSLTLIDWDPNSLFVHKLVALPYCRFNRFYTSDNLNHWTYELYF